MTASTDTPPRQCAPVAQARFVAALFALALLIAAPFAAARPFVFTAIPDEDESRLQERFQAVARYLSAALEVDVRYVPVKSYAVAITAFRNNQVQLAWFGGLSGLRARALVPGSRAIAQGVEDRQFKTYFIAHRRTGLEPADALPTALRGMTFTFGAKGSTSGRLMPEHYLRERFGEAPAALFRRVGFSGNHSRTVALVASGAYQVGALSYTAWEMEKAAGHVDGDAVLVIWETPSYPDYQWTIRGDVDGHYGAGFTERVQQALIAMDDPDLLARFPRSGFVPASNDDYDVLAQIARELDLL